MHKDLKHIERVAILVDTSTTWSRELVQGILSYTKSHDPWHIHLQAQPRNDRLYLPKNWEGDGVIARISSQAIAEELDALGLPVVNISAIQIPGADHPRVITSPESEARIAYETLRARGFNEFAYAGDMEQTYVVRHHDAFVKVLAKHGHPPALTPPGPTGPWTPG